MIENFNIIEKMKKNKKSNYFIIVLFFHKILFKKCIYKVF